MPQSSRFFVRTALGALIALLVAPSEAALLPATGEYRIQFGNNPAAVITGSGFASSTGGPGTSHTVPAGFFSLAAPLSVAITPALAGLAGYTIPSGAQNGGGSFAPGGTMPLLASGMLFGTAGQFGGIIPLSLVGGTGTVPFGWGGIGGIFQGAPFQGAGGATPVVIQSNQALLAIPITVTATAYDNRTAAGLGTVQLVAPAAALASIFGTIPVFGVVTIQYTPEPATWLLLAGGLAALGVGNRRLRAGRAAPAPRA